MKPLLETIFAMVFSWAVMLLLQRSVRPMARQNGSRKIMEYGWPIRVFGIVFALFGAFLVFMVIAASHSPPKNKMAAWIISGLLAAAGFFMFIEALFVRIEFDDECIYTFSPWRKRRTIPWGDILGCRFSEMNQWYVIPTRRNGNLRVSTSLSGIGSFREELAERGHPTEEEEEEDP